MIRTKSHYILFTTGKKSKTETEYIFTIYVFLTIPAPKKPPVAIGISSTAEKKMAMTQRISTEHPHPSLLYTRFPKERGKTAHQSFKL